MNDNETTTALATTHALPVRAMSDLQTIGEAIAASGMFGVSNAASGLVMAVTCHQQGMSLMEFKETYHIIHGTPSMRADAMLSRFNEMGGEIEIHERSPSAVLITAKYGKATYKTGLTWDEAEKEPFVYVGKEADVVAMLGHGKKPQLKSKYATPRSRMQMLWARVVSDAIRTVCPKANKGVYTPEEVQDFDTGNATKPHVISADDVATRISNAVPVQAEEVQDAPYDDDICPTGGPQYEGKRWNELPTEVLNAAFASTLPEITIEHKERIAIVLVARGEGVSL